jgi:hypothetical protein
MLELQCELQCTASPIIRPEYILAVDLHHLSASLHLGTLTSEPYLKGQGRAINRALNA